MKHLVFTGGSLFLSGSRTLRFFQAALITVLFFTVACEGLYYEEDPDEQDLSEDRIETEVRALGVPVDGLPTYHGRTLHHMTNRIRAGMHCGNAGLRCDGAPVRPLRWYHDAGRAAQWFARHLHDARCFQHRTCCWLEVVNGVVQCNSQGYQCSGGTGNCSSNNCSGTSTADRLALFGASYTGENLAAGHSTAAATICQWLNSPGHRTNMCNPNHGALGTGHYAGSDCYNSYWVQNFAGGPPPAGIVSGSHWPGSSGTVFGALLYFPGATSSPMSADVVLNGVCRNMTREFGNNVTGSFITGNLNPGSGCHEYWFLVRNAGGVRYTYPSTGSYRFGTGCGGQYTTNRTDADCEVCIPNCAGKQCGPDGCGGSCGTCGTNEVCQSGQCVCQPNCSGKQCGPDGCGGSCGTCGTNEVCQSGQCVCQPNCSGKQCGPDGCGGSCGTCGTNEVCQSGQCVCQPNCSGKQCGPDGCGGSCGTCHTNELCQDGQCVCQPDCTGKLCGPDGCGGSCGTCGANEVCESGQCVFSCSEELANCGGVCVDLQSDHGHCGECGNVCGNKETCIDGQCVCEPDCGGKQCGPDGCGGSCGTCDSDEVCQDGQCGSSCTDGLTPCDGVCVDLLDDENHCGECNNNCRPAENCIDGECVYISVDGGVIDPGDDAGAPGIKSVVGGCSCRSSQSSSGTPLFLLLFLFAIVIQSNRFRTTGRRS